MALLVLLFLLIGPLLCVGSEEEYRLIQDLRKDYDPIERPVMNHKQPIDVMLRIYLQQILEIVS